MRVKAAINVVISQDDDQTQKLGPDVDIVIDDSTPTHHKASVYDLAAAAAETQYTFSPEVTNGKYLVIQVISGEVSFKFNSNTAPAISMKPNPATAIDPIQPYQATPQPGIIWMGPLSPTNPLTTLYVHNVSSTVAARIAIALVGEAS